MLEGPAVLVCADGIESFRELLGVLEKLILAKTPLVVVAPAIAPDVLATLEVNKIRQTMRLLVVTPDEAGLDTGRQDLPGDGRRPQGPAGGRRT